MDEARFPFRPRPCPLEKYLELMSGSWVVRILWHLLDPDGPRRFSDLQRALGGISAKVLTQKLRTLEREGFVARTAERSIPACSSGGSGSN